ncbi:MAG: hypothetical protein AAF639_44250, partial [Chloroflexota bacterium]
GAHGETLAQMLADDSELRDLAQTPLMLSVMTLALQGDDRLSDNPDRSPAQRLFDRYIQRMFQHRGLEHKYTTSDSDALRTINVYRRELVVNIVLCVVVFKRLAVHEANHRRPWLLD